MATYLEVVFSGFFSALRSQDRPGWKAFPQRKQTRLSRPDLPLFPFFFPFLVDVSVDWLSEELALWQWLGFLLVLGGILVVVYQRSYQSIDRKQLLIGVALAASSVFLTAGGVVAMKPLLEHSGFFWMVSLRMLAGIVGMLIILALRRKLIATYEAIRFKQHNWRGVMAASFLGSYLALIFWLAGFKYADASVASVLNETANIFIVFIFTIN